MWPQMKHDLSSMEYYSCGHTVKDNYFNSYFNLSRSLDALVARWCLLYCGNQIVHTSAAYFHHNY